MEEVMTNDCMDSDSLGKYPAKRKKKKIKHSENVTCKYNNENLNKSTKKTFQLKEIKNIQKY